MPVTTPPTIPSFSTPAPNRSDPATFSSRMDTYLGEMQPSVDGENALSAWMNTTATDVHASATAVASALGLTSYKGVYVGGSSYALGDSVVSAGGDFWVSNTAANTGNPLNPGTYWAKIDLSSIAVKTSGLNIDWAAEDILKFTATADFTVTFSNIPTGGIVLVEIKGGGDWTGTFPTVVGDIPALATGADTTVLGFYTSNGGATVSISAFIAAVAL